MELENVFDSISSRYEADGFDGISAAEKHFLVVWCAGALISNGGFESYYIEEMIGPVGETPESFDAAGLPEHAEVLRRANLLFTSKKLSDDIDDRSDEVCQIIETHTDEVEQLEEDFFVLVPDPYEALETFFKSNRQQFNV